MKIQVEHFGPRLVAGFVALAGSEAPSQGHKKVDARPSGANCRHHALDFIRESQIDLLAEELFRKFRRVALESCPLSGVAIRNGHARAGFQQLERHGAAQRARPARDQRHTILKCHKCSVVS